MCVQSAWRERARHCARFCAKIEGFKQGEDSGCVFVVRTRTSVLFTVSRPCVNKGGKGSKENGGSPEKVGHWVGFRRVVTVAASQNENSVFP